MGNENSISSDLIRGHIDTIILRALYDSDKHGNEICLDIEDKSGGQYEIKQPTLYSALKRLETSGLVNAYWASGVGGRRRYFKLTDEGRKVCEENLNLWIHSRNVIDKLISDGTDLGYPVYEPVEKTDFPVYVPPVEDYTPQPKFDPSEYENYSFTSAITQETANDEDFVEPEEFAFNSPPQTQQEESVVPVLKSVDDTDPDAKIIADENETNLNNINDDSSVTQLSLIEEPEVIEEPTAEEVEVLPIQEEQPVEIPATTEAKTTEEKQVDGDDDTLVLEPYASIDKEYGDILKRLYPKVYEEEPENVELQEDDTKDASEPIELKQEPPIQQPTIPLPEENYEVKNKTVTVTTEDEKVEVRKVEKEKNNGEIDYTDIISLAHMQGFRVKTSDKTNRARKGKLFATKLISASALILFALMLIEMCAICLPLNDILMFKWKEFCIFIGILLVFPLATLIALIIKPKYTVNKLPTLKYCITASIVAVLNLILLNFALVLALQVDLYVAKNILLFLIIPCIVYLNIPLYFIIKYLLVSKKMFFTID